MLGKISKLTKFSLVKILHIFESAKSIRRPFNPFNIQLIEKESEKKDEEYKKVLYFCFPEPST